MQLYIWLYIYIYIYIEREGLWCLLLKACGGLVVVVHSVLFVVCCVLSVDIGVVGVVGVCCWWYGVC